MVAACYPVCSLPLPPHLASSYGLWEKGARRVSPNTPEKYPGPLQPSTPLPPGEDDDSPQTIGEARKGGRARKPTNKNKSYEVSPCRRNTSHCQTADRCRVLPRLEPQVASPSETDSSSAAAGPLRKGKERDLETVTPSLKLKLNVRSRNDQSGSRLPARSNRVNGASTPNYFAGDMDYYSSSDERGTRNL